MYPIVSYHELRRVIEQNSGSWQSKLCQEDLVKTEGFTCAVVAVIFEVTLRL
jgi:hypothetical protein